MTISAKIIADSISQQGIRLTTMQLRYPKFIHGEAKTHRVMRAGDKAYEFLEEVGFMDDPNLSRNASSSRAIPVERLIQDVIDDPVMPVFWGSNKTGMQAGEELVKDLMFRARAQWLRASNSAIEYAREMSRLGAHKQIVNRIIEPWCHINVVVTATEWANFYALRRHKDAQPEMQALANAMWDAQQASTPVLLKPGEWHLPYATEGDNSAVRMSMWPTHSTISTTDMNPYLIKLSVARCARVSYLTHEGKPPNVEDDLKLYERLVGSEPLHASPAEHQATPDEWCHATSNELYKQHGANWWYAPRKHGNFVGWLQFRKMLPNENVSDR